MVGRRLPGEHGFRAPQDLRYWSERPNPNAPEDSYAPRQFSQELEGLGLSFAERQGGYMRKRLYYVGDIHIAQAYHQFDRWWVVLARGSFFSSLIGRWFNSEDAMEAFLADKLRG